MKRILLAIMVMFLTSPAMADDSYVVGDGDVLLISVWKDDALTRTVTVLPDGRITFPLIGEVPAAGLTIDALTVELKRRLERYVPEPELSVAVTQVNSNAVYILGEVVRPGRYNLSGRTDVLQALAMAGGLSPYAGQNRIRVLRRNGEEQEVHKVKYRKIARGKKLKSNIILQRGDVIVVP